MALISCSECGREISTKAETCPGCGAPNQVSFNVEVEAQKKSSNAPIYRLIGVIFALFVLYLIFKPNHTNEKATELADNRATAEPVAETQKQDVPQSPPIPVQEEVHPIEVSAQQLISEYEANEVAADLKYKKKLLQVTGVVESINKDIVDSIYVKISGKSSFSGIHANGFSVEQAVNLKKGQSITVTCVGAGMVLSSPILKNCVQTSVQSNSTPANIFGTYTFDAFNNKKFQSLITNLVKNESFENLAQSFTVSSEIKKDENFIVGTGCQEHNCGANNGIFFYNTKNNQISIYVYKMEDENNGKIRGWGIPINSETVKDSQQVPLTARQWFVEHGANLE